MMNAPRTRRFGSPRVEGLESRQLLAGDFSFAFPLGSAGGDCSVNAVATDSAGNSYVTGSFTGAVDFNPSSRRSLVLTAGSDGDAFVAKYTRAGGFVWARQVVNAGGPDAGNGVAVDASGNVVVGGRFRGSADFKPGKGVKRLVSAGFTDASAPTKFDDGFLWKLNAKGNFVAVAQVRGNGDDSVEAVALDGLGSAYATGYFSRDATFGDSTVRTSNGQRDGFLARFTPSLGFIFNRQVGGLGDDVMEGIALDQSGFPIAAGTFSGTAEVDSRAHHDDPDEILPMHNEATAFLTSRGGTDAMLMKVNDEGFFIFAKTFGGAGNDRATAVRIDKVGSAITAGTFTGTAGFDPANVNGGQLASAGSTDAYVSKLNALGNFVWARKAGGAGADDAAAITTNRAGDVFVAGSFTGTVDFAPGAGVVNLAGRPNVRNGFVWRLTVAGDLGYARMFQAQNDGSFAARGIALDPTGNVYVAGTFAGQVDFDPGAGVRIRNSGATAEDDGFLAKLLA